MKKLLLLLVLILSIGINCFSQLNYEKINTFKETLIKGDKSGVKLVIPSSIINFESFNKTQWIYNINHVEETYTLPEYEYFYPLNENKEPFFLENQMKVIFGSDGVFAYFCTDENGLYVDVILGFDLLGNLKFIKRRSKFTFSGWEECYSEEGTYRKRGEEEEVPKKIRNEMNEYEKEALEIFKHLVKLVNEEFFSPPSEKKYWDLVFSINPLSLKESKKNGWAINPSSSFFNYVFSYHLEEGFVEIFFNLINQEIYVQKKILNVPLPKDGETITIVGIEGIEKLFKTTTFVGEEKIKWLEFFNSSF